MQPMQEAPLEPGLDPGLVQACGETPATMCEWLWDRTGDVTLTKVADWVIGRPLSVLVILAIAWLAAWLARRAIRKAVYRVVMADRAAAARAIGKVVPAAGASIDDDPRRAARARSIATVVSSTASVAIWVVATLVALGQFEINLAPLIAGAGIAGIAIGFGAQNLVKDCINGLFMLIEDQYGIGDVVDLGLATGTVERFTLRTTVLRGQDGTVWHVPNGEVRRVGNHSKLWSVAVVDVTVAYDADLARAREVVTDAATAVCDDDRFAGDVLAAPDLLGVESVAADGVVLRLLVRTNPGAQYRVQRALREAVKLALDAAGVTVLAQPVPGPPPAGDGA